MNLSLSQPMVSFMMIFCLHIIFRSLCERISFFGCNFCGCKLLAYKISDSLSGLDTRGHIL